MLLHKEKITATASSGFKFNAGDKFSFLIQDDLTGLDYLSFRIKGRISDV
jgi:hypothetical protein